MKVQVAYNQVWEQNLSLAGINQTHHKIYLDIDSRVGILTPFATFGKDIKSEVLLTEAIIVGEVPDSYYNLDGVQNPNETYNFIE